MTKHQKIYDEPSKVATHTGEVMVDGPDAVSVSLTPAAAIETGTRLIDAAAEAEGKKITEDARRRRGEG